METLAFGIEGMQRGACAANIERRFYSVTGVQSAVVSFVAATAEITYDPRQTDAATLASAVAEAGYAAHLMTDTSTAPARAPAGQGAVASKGKTGCNCG